MFLNGAAALETTLAPRALLETFLRIERELGRVRDGVRFGPPVSRELTSKDVAYAFERIGTPSLVAQYGFYFDVIEGMEAFRAGEATEIAGIETPDERTIVFHLTRPTGDFGYRLAMPATAPIPEEVARCFTEAGEYGRFLIASGPYMIEGSEALDAKSLTSLEENLVREVTTLFYARRRVLASILLSPEQEDEAFFYELVRLDELTSTLDAFTGGKFGKKAWDWQAEMVGK